MLGRIRRAALGLGAAVAIAGACYGVGSWRGYGAGYSAAEGDAAAARRGVQDDLAAAGDEIADLARELERQRGLADGRGLQFEDEARADPDSDRPGVGADGVRRLDQRWRRP
jgi:hypothetical protein